MCVDYERLEEGYSTDNLFIRKSAVDPILPSVYIVPELFDCLVRCTWFVALEVTY